MRFRIIRPTGILAQFIKYYWVMEKSSMEDDVCERVIPAGNIDLMFHYKNCFKVKCSNNNTYKQAYSLISGINNSYADATTNGETGLICVTFHPFGACNFFNFRFLRSKTRILVWIAFWQRIQRDILEALCC